MLSEIDSLLDYYLVGNGQFLNPFVTYFLYFASIIGILYIIYDSYCILSLLNRQCFRGRKNLLKRYGDNDSWVVVSGGSDGIGLDYCKEMARTGFNVCIIGRNPQKINEKLKEIASVAKSKSFKSKSIIADFSKMTKISDYEKIADQAKDIDIAILFANAGYLKMGPLADLPVDEIEATVTLDTLQPVYLIKTFLPLLLRRKQKSGIIVTSSAFGTFVAPGIATYNASKAFATYIAQGLNYELKGKIDVLSYEAGRVSTKLLGEKPKGSIITTEKAVASSLRDLGSEARTYGALIHEIAITLTKNLMPLKFRNNLLYTTSVQSLKQSQAEDKNKKNQ